MSKSTTFGERLAAARYRRGWTQGQVAESIGQTRSAVCHYEKGSKLPTFASLRLLCIALQADANYLLGLDE